MNKVNEKSIGGIIAKLCRLLGLQSEDMMIRHLLIWHEEVKKKDKEAMKRVLERHKEEIDGIVKLLSGGK